MDTSYKELIHKMIEQINSEKRLKQIYTIVRRMIAREIENRDVVNG